MPMKGIRGVGGCLLQGRVRVSGFSLLVLAGVRRLRVGMDRFRGNIVLKMKNKFYTRGQTGLASNYSDGSFPSVRSPGFGPKSGGGTSAVALHAKDRLHRLIQNIICSVWENGCKWFSTDSSRGRFVLA